MLENAGHLLESKLADDLLSPVWSRGQGDPFVRQQKSELLLNVIRSCCEDMSISLEVQQLQVQSQYASLRRQSEAQE